MYNIDYRYKEEARKHPFLKAAFLKNFRVGIEIEANIEEEETSCEMSPGECGVCDNCHVCERCEDNEVYCNNCRNYQNDSEEDRCTHREEDFCNFYTQDICGMCQTEEVRCSGCDPCDGCEDRHTDTNIDSVHEDIANHLKCTSGHCEYKENNGNFQCVYNDGSVNTEIVTSALKPKDFKTVVCEGINALLDEGGEISPYQKAGFHQTFSFGHTFPDIVCKNVIQLIRFYLPALLCVSCIDGTYQRNNGSNFRAIPESGLKMGEEIYNEKYTAVHTKKIGNLSSPSLLEFRYPDATENINQTALTMLFNTAIIAKAFDESEKGIIEISQRHFNRVKEDVGSIYSTGDYYHYEWVKLLVFEMFAYLKPELSKITDIENVYHALIDITNHHAGHMENNEDIKEVKIK